ncbi:hypothetical protein J132_08977 [Termitomyces sp. J132]|nr:hypothetical protein H2248_004421 [Termitomyces sp. 'cryptogamus']KNZ76698.1 hypothetical protein J132_08977 [Termitomyces sp. J132]
MTLSRRIFCSVKHYSTTRIPFVYIPKANVYRFGDSNTASPVFRDLSWTIHEDEAWAVVGSGSGEKSTLLETLLGHLRLAPTPPPPGGLFPALTEAGRDPFTNIVSVSFSNRRRAAGDAFYDYSARYGAVREEDRITLRQSMFPETIPPPFPELELPRADGDAPKGMPDKERRAFDVLVDKIGLRDFLDLPIIVLSNGQTRRARIVKALLRKPELLLLDEPLTGLDVQNRPTLLEVLRTLHAAKTPRVILGLRTHDPIPEWITHVAFVHGSKVVTGPKDDVVPKITHVDVDRPVVQMARSGQDKLLVDMQNVSVKYGPRSVLRGIDWQIRQGERWHLQGSNGSGKTTLLSLLTGDHPQSYTQRHLHLHGRPRSRISTPHLQSLTGVFSPELFDAFPRHAGMRVWDAIGTGFDGGFVPLGRENVGLGVLQPVTEADIAWRVSRCWEVLEALSPATWETGVVPNGVSARAVAEEFSKRKFVDLSVGGQRMVLLMRALVGRAPLILLDEVWSGMGEGMVRAARRYLREGGVGPEQGVIVVTHWEEEVPWGTEDGVKRFKIDGGVGQVA